MDYTGTKGKTHFKTPYDFRERTDVCIVDHEIIIDAVDDQGQVQSVECPKVSGNSVIATCSIMAT